MRNLNNFLSCFNKATIQRSASYVEQIDLSTLDIMTENDITFVYAQIEGTDYYDTTIFYHSVLDRLVDTDCSCPVGIHCKHAAALARLFYEYYLNQKQSSSSLLSSPSHAEVDLQYMQAESWLNQFKYKIQDLVADNTQHNITDSKLIYIFNRKKHSTQIDVSLQKVRRNKQGEIRETTRYDVYENIINGRLKVSEAEKDLFLELYFYNNLNSKNRYFSTELDISGILQPQLQHFIQNAEAYWEKHQNPRLQWSDQAYHLEFSWHNDIVANSEKLELYLIDQEQHRVLLKDCNHFHLIMSKPLCYLDSLQHRIGAIHSPYPTALIQQLLNMPAIPLNLLGQFQDIISSQLQHSPLPEPKALQSLPTITGEAIPILRFGGYRHLELKLAEYQIVFVEVEFEYPAGRIKANHAEESFISHQQQQPVRQQRDIKQEQHMIQQLQQSIPTLVWTKDHPIFKKTQLDLAQFNNVLIGPHHDCLDQLIPVNHIEQLGWKIEHSAQSALNLQAITNLEWSLQDSAQNDWFDIGVTIQDQQGQQHDLITLLAQLTKHYPQFLDSDYLETVDDSSIISIAIAPDQPKLAITLQHIKPIFYYLKEILQQPENRRVDRYDAYQLLDLNDHHLGMSWQSSERLQAFAKSLKQGYQNSIATPQGFQAELRPYQQQGLAWLQFLRETAHGGILADDMGLGKTAQTLAHILLEHQAGRLDGKPALIIAPTSLMQNWFKEAQKFTPELKVLILQGSQRHHLFTEIPAHHIVLSTYPLLSRDEEHLMQHQYHLLILDEAQNIKNPRAKAAQIARQLPAQHRLCLTGTPMENHLGELWSLFHFLMPGFLYSQEMFNKKFRHPIEKQADSKTKNLLVSRIKPFMLRRLKTDVATELPEKTTIEVDISMNTQQEKLYEAVRATMQKNIREIIAEKGFERSQIQILDALLKLRQVCCHPSLLKLDSLQTTTTASAKLDQLLEMVTAMLEEGRRILIFSQFTSMLHIIEQALQAQNVPLVKLTGQTKKREQAIDAFQSGQVPVFLISLKAGGVGLNLTSADTVIHYDPWWNPAAEEQASDRAWRIGQDKPVFVYKLITSQSIEEKIIQMQKNKAQLTRSILSIDQQDDIKLSEDDIMQLFD
ncbi:DEAD/DEAH box helicase [Acinetobacter larvae]|uniref:Heavy metal resistance protein CzcA n=1 Tax=Acinetobacter larvae TaxID=1789224 RepID=A0A1B2LVH5_9GAMM|nr:DEAD/DEAH box helicase [Acinetobacter larvae]AOA56920.1 heavy metal resistance protein CzcA [Acinetobacter larvae]